MDEYTVDVAPDQVVRWLMAELQRNPDALEFRANRTFVAAGVENFEDDGISEDTDVESVAAVAILEVMPARPTKNWILRLRVEDILGEHLPEDHSASEDPEEIELETFDALFVAPGRGILDVALFAETPQAKAEFDAIFVDMLRDRHDG
ncbi:MAG: hypothetical protein GY798_12480 [Hyphomicrobiales bacterium]|nr:hypothetical protein [Hyphomicrobiales bacterium]